MDSIVGAIFTFVTGLIFVGLGILFAVLISKTHLFLLFKIILIAVELIYHLSIGIVFGFNFTSIMLFDNLDLGTD